jgi:hypothetical protein
MGIAVGPDIEVTSAVGAQILHDGILPVKSDPYGRLMDRQALYHINASAT